ncbi:FKBP-type peptidyl-prolyl cis-trans isomerase N-terminal domain-containing protein [uncultured Campylobacter sp.]|uniref:FKBP-type peptidyl-prolyl cis-trans isomerase N-terminal domain-containing protein n=1 Tax=uncultured Campylobacter sp. TaxID=218934 RepID=UPI0026070003|nr:FKBP-type peptidyl-prolyl cis-trans isomerase N-terminal domain-containing protein [uncultured Campylobacter sp.]
MQKTLFLVPLLAASLSFGADLTQNDQREAYAIGASTAKYLMNQISGQEKLGIKTDKDIVIEGFLDVFKDGSKIKNDEIEKLLNDRAAKLNKAVDAIAKAEVEKNLKAGEEFMAKNAKNPNVKTTKSGVQYEILKSAKGDKPKPESIIVLNYKAYLLDGTVFDETYSAKMPAHLSMINLIDGLQEGLLMMDTGSKYKFVIPSDLAYGNEGMEKIPGGSTVVFEAELLKVLKPGELAEAAKKLSESEAKSFHDANKTK